MKNDKFIPLKAIPIKKELKQLKLKRRYCIRGINTTRW